MHLLDEQVDVRLEHDVPSEFLWRGRLWRVRAVLSHGPDLVLGSSSGWGPWWTSPEVRAVVAAEGSSQQAIADSVRVRVGSGTATLATLDVPPLLAEPEVWRVEAHCPPRPGRPRLAAHETRSATFDLAFSPATGCWRITGRRGEEA